MTGCTCGKCVGGVLSPKTSYRVRTCAESSAELLNETLPSWPPGDQPVHDPQVFLFDYVPPELRMEVTKPFVVGYANCMATVAYLLRQGQLPKPRLVKQCAGIVPGVDRSASAAYLERGGQPEYALDGILARCVDEHETLGDGSFVLEERHAAQLEALPPCDNDDKFELVRQKLFENSDFWPCGPYGYDDEGVEGEDDGTVYYS